MNAAGAFVAALVVLSGGVVLPVDFVHQESDVTPGDTMTKSILTEKVTGHGLAIGYYHRAGEPGDVRLVAVAAGNAESPDDPATLNAQRDDILLLKFV